MATLSELYEARIRLDRRAAASHPSLGTLLDPAIDPILMERFLIEYCAWGVQITEPVEGWIRRAGERCVAIGLDAVGKGLIAHARHEAGHHLLFIHDTRALVQRWNASRPGALDAEALMARPPTPAMIAYINLHERNIESDTPFAQIAIEYEVEALSVSALPALLQQFARVLGADVLEGLSFLTSHAELDVGHTSQNRRLLNALLEARPDALDTLVEAGSGALSAYVDFLGECVSAASGAARSLGSR
jgi:Iron-containing redox enzyme